MDRSPLASFPVSIVLGGCQGVDGEWDGVSLSSWDTRAICIPHGSPVTGGAERWAWGAVLALPLSLLMSGSQAFSSGRAIECLILKALG